MDYLTRDNMIYLTTSIDVYEKQMEEQTEKYTKIEIKHIIDNKRRLNTVLKNFYNILGTGLAHGKKHEYLQYFLLFDFRK